MNKLNEFTAILLIHLWNILEELEQRLLKDVFHA